jgi:hypothetical protein
MLWMGVFQMLLPATPTCKIVKLDYDLISQALNVPQHLKLNSDTLH